MVLNFLRGQAESVGVALTMVVVALAVSACSNGGLTQVESKPSEQIAKMEEVLAGVGFEPHYAKTQKNFDVIKSLPQHTLMFHEYRKSYRYVYADSQLCGCIYVGDKEAYRRYQEMRGQNDILDLQAEAAVFSDTPASGWDEWGPWYDSTN